MPLTIGVDRRFRKYVVVLPYSGCWQWTGACNWGGYGKFWFEGRTVAAHRWSYERHVGPIPDGLTIDHLCGNRACVNPAHLEAVTGRENWERGNHQGKRTHCPAGHPYDEKNTYVWRRGDRPERGCRACRNQHAKNYVQRRKVS